ncbi:hypothetical protein [Legionella maioricensis]|uniref:Uncharacterized protein n=1 Tax=Legionella maioricensis TaxID=2896528 RepID=A0A9X2CXK9_9GAMM|nr:hypothetical protein [Legionella maioricensis]MCL9682675.1 hypothetical protein [Legionella maioricensis]MCL9687278.1 hypothetical protein [Legionella maioricensis]
MSYDKNEEPPLLSQEECDNLLSTCSVNAMHAHKSGNNDVYHEEISSLAIACHVLITHHLKAPHLIIAQMETAMCNARREDLEVIDNKIKHLFNLRKEAPADTFYGEQQIINITTQITILEECKAMPIKEIIQKIIYESLEQAIKIHGTEMPVNFNLTQYEYHPASTESTSPHTKLSKGMW